MVGKVPVSQHEGVKFPIHFQRRYDGKLLIHHIGSTLFPLVAMPWWRMHLGLARALRERQRMPIIMWKRLYKFARVFTTTTKRSAGQGGVKGAYCKYDTKKLEIQLVKLLCKLVFTRLKKFWKYSRHKNLVQSRPSLKNYSELEHGVGFTEEC